MHAARKNGGQPVGNAGRIYYINMYGNTCWLSTTVYCWITLFDYVMVVMRSLSPLPMGPDMVIDCIRQCTCAKFVVLLVG